MVQIITYLVLLWLVASAFTLNWTAVPEDNIAGFWLYRKSEACSGPASLLPIMDVGNVYSVTDTPTDATTYCYGIKAYSTWGAMSDMSNLVELTKDAPSPPVVCVRRTPKGKCVKWQ